MFIQHNNVYLMVAARQNCNAASLLSFLHRLVDVSCIYDQSVLQQRILVFQTCLIWINDSVPIILVPKVTMFNKTLDRISKNSRLLRIFIFYQQEENNFLSD